MKHYELFRRYISLFLILSIFSSYSLAEELSLPSDKRLIVIASRQTIEEANSIAEFYRKTFKNTSIFSTSNGWYAITIGTISYPQEKYLLNQYISQGYIPNDSRLASGKGFVGTISRGTTGGNGNSSTSNQTTTNGSSSEISWGKILGAAVAAIILNSMKNGSHGSSTSTYTSSSNQPSSQKSDDNSCGSTCAEALYHMHQESEQQQEKIDTERERESHGYEPRHESDTNFGNHEE